jgi:hypothetical protein
VRWLGHARHAGDGGLAALVLETDAELGSDAGAGLLDGGDEPLLEEDLGEGVLELGIRHARLLLPHRGGVAEPSEHVGDGIGDHMRVRFTRTPS